VLKRILVPLDGSEFAEHALPLAFDIARRAGAAVRLMRVHIPAVPMAAVGDLSAPVFDPAWDEHLRSAANDYLDTIATRGRRCGVIVTTEVADHPSVGEQIEASAGAFSADLIVMTTHGTSGHSLAWFGSVADAVLRHSLRPTLIVPEQATNRFTIRRILVCTDGSRAAERTADAAAELASVYGADISLVQVVLSSAGGGDPRLVSHRGSHTDGVVEAARSALDDTAGRLRAHGRTVTTMTLVSSQPARALLDHMKETAPDIVALGTHGRGLSRLFIGSVADKVMRGGRTPTLVQRLAT